MSLHFHISIKRNLQELLKVIHCFVFLALLVNDNQFTISLQKLKFLTNISGSRQSYFSVVFRYSKFKIFPVELTANFGRKTVHILQVGPNHSFLNDTIIGMGLSTTAKNGDSLSVLAGTLKYTVHFELDDSPPKKIPKMFLKGVGEEFKKDSALDNGTWEVIGSNDLLVYVYGGSGLKDAKSKIAAFDLDGTIITTKSGRVFPKDKNDWKFLYPTTTEILRKFFASNSEFKFVVFTNQGGCKTQTDIDNIKFKIEKITKDIGLPVLVFIAPNKNMYRKPIRGAWDAFVAKYNGECSPDLNESFYCGDAAGRKKDHALSDRLFALNIGISFKVPEEFFIGHGRKVTEFGMPVFDPKQYIEKHPSNDHIKLSQKQEMVIMVGYPGSGKSSFVKSKLLTNGYGHVNRDTLKTAEKCLKLTENLLQSGQPVVIDNTSPEKKDRAEYIKLAKKYGIPVRCFKMNVDHAHALHNNKFRELTSDSHLSVPAVAFNTFKARYQPPTKEEGFSEVIDVQFIPNFDNYEEPEKTKRYNLYTSYLLEK